MEASPSPFTLVSPRRAMRWLVSVAVIVGSIGFILFFVYRSFNAPPTSFPVNTPITIESGSSISQIVATLKQHNVVKSELLLYILLLTAYTPQDIKASTYVFDQPYNTRTIAHKLATGDYTSNLVRITHREGERVTELATVVATAIPTIATSTFIDVAISQEGYLFPETYFVPPHFTANDIVTTLHANYETFIVPYRDDIASSTLTESELITLASIVEREANSTTSMGMVAGILRNRLDLGMPLQADASIEYILDKPLNELVPSDLEIDSPYNTYLYRGLPPTPIGNPGADAILATLFPTTSPYLFYITGNDGNFYYAETYAEHQRNIARYLMN